jgi:putative photosynthetic complex assembly protein 2
MTDYAFPVATTLLVWWFSTGAILWLVRRPAAYRGWMMGGATLLMGGALAGLVATRDDTTVVGAYGAFGSALVVWAWQEVSFLLGYITGPRRLPCPPASTGWRRAGYAFAVIAHHELALVVLALAVWLCTAGGANPFGLWTFAVLWVMRQSAKLNLFLGVRNTSEEFLPMRLRYIASYFRRRPLNPLLPPAFAAAVALAALLTLRALAVSAGSFEATGYLLVATLALLGALEHAFLVLPLPATALWRWSLRPRSERPATAGAIPGTTTP